MTTLEGSASGSAALNGACRTVIDLVFKAQGSIAVEEELFDLRQVVEAVKAGAAPAAAPVAEKPAEVRKSMMTEQETAEACRLRMLWMSEIGNSPQDVADSLRWNRPQSVSEEQEMQAQEKLEAELLAQARAEAGILD